MKEEKMRAMQERKVGYLAGTLTREEEQEEEQEEATDARERADEEADANADKPAAVVYGKDDESILAIIDNDNDDDESVLSIAVDEDNDESVYDGPEIKVAGSED